MFECLNVYVSIYVYVSMCMFECVNVSNFYL
jgi:hypothetical protein